MMGWPFANEFPQQENWSSYALTDEGSTFRFVDDPRILTLFLPNFTTSHEGEYSSLLLSEVKEDSLMDMPTLFQLHGPTYLALPKPLWRTMQECI
jgi:alpha-glucosidase